MGGPRGYAGACGAFAGSVGSGASAHGVTGLSLGPSPGSVVGHRRRSGRAARRLRCGTWARQGRRVTTAADCLSLLGLDHTDGGPEVKGRTERPLRKATRSRQVASRRRALGANACDARRSAARTIGADRAGRVDGAVARLAGSGGLRSSDPLISLVPPAPGPDAVRRARAGPYPRGRFGPCGRSAAGRTRHPPVRGTSPVIHPAESGPADSGRKLSSPVPCGRAYADKPPGAPREAPDTRRGSGCAYHPEPRRNPNQNPNQNPNPNPNQNPNP